MKIYIYAIYFLTSDKYYIGQTNNLNRRLMKQHFNSGSLVCNALWKYDDWQVTILHTCKSCDEANKIEIEEIRNFNSVAPNGYNETRGGDGGDCWNGKERPKHSVETREKMGKSQQGNKNGRGKKKPGTSKALLGNRYGLGKHWKLTEETLEKRRGNKNVSHRIDVKIKRLKTRIKKLEQLN